MTSSLRCPTDRDTVIGEGNLRFNPKGLVVTAVFILGFLLALQSGNVSGVDSWYRSFEVALVAVLSIGAIMSMIRNRTFQVDSYGWICQLGRRRKS
jgi:hypothetical protein